VNQPVEDRQALVIPLGTPPGNYHLTLALYDPTTRGVLLLANGASTLELSRVQVQTNSESLAPATEHLADAQFGRSLGLLGFSGVAQTARAGETWPIDLVWHANDIQGGKLMAVFQWLDTDGHAIGENQLTIGTSAYPLSQWQQGEYIRQHFDVPVPDVAQSDLRIALRVRDEMTGQMLQTIIPSEGFGGFANLGFSFLELASVTVRQMERNFIAPEPQHPFQAFFGELGQLVGYEMMLGKRNMLNVMLYWRALSESGLNYKVFVHLISADGKLIAQHDSQPANDFRPTHGWQSGEYIKDGHQINLAGVAPGDYELEVGLYDPTSGVRLPVNLNQAIQPDGRAVLTVVRVP
jgi:hypothetical protein